MPEIDVDEKNNLNIKNKSVNSLSKNESEKIDTSYGKFITKVFWKISGPLSLIIGFIFSFALFKSEEIDYFSIIYASFLIIFGGFATYITYMRNK
jgi:hypothetical protein